MQLRRGFGALLLLRLQGLQPRHQVRDKRMPLVQIQPKRVGRVDRVLPFAFQALQTFGQLEDGLLTSLGFAAQQPGRVQQLLALGVEHIVPAAQFGQLLVRAIQLGKRRRLGVRHSPRFDDRLLQPGNLLRMRLLEGSALVARLGKSPFQVGELVVDRELVGLRLSRLFQLRRQTPALGVVCGLLLGLPRRGLDQRMLQPARFGDVPERQEHRHNPVGRAWMSAGMKLEGVTRAGEADKVRFKRPALAPIARSRNAWQALCSSVGTRLVSAVPRICSSEVAPSIDNPASLIARKVPSLLTRARTTGWLSRTARRCGSASTGTMPTVAVPEALLTAWLSAGNTGKITHLPLIARRFP